jgi:hypothetical protein
LLKGLKGLFTEDVVVYEYIEVPAPTPWITQDITGEVKIIPRTQLLVVKKVNGVVVGPTIGNNW